MKNFSLPRQGLLQTTIMIVAFSVFGIVTAQAQSCPPELRDRTPNQVVEDLQDDTAARDWDAVACNYKKNAFILDDQGILVGRADIVAAAQSLSSLFVGVDPEITQEETYHNTVRSLWTLDGGWVLIPDGVSTYFIRNGKIKWQTNHGLIQFTGPPPDPGTGGTPSDPGTGGTPPP